MKKLVFSLLFTLIFSLNASQALASTYGPYDEPEPSPDILIDKKVGVPYTISDGKTEYTYYDNLSTTDHRFKEKDYVFFYVRVKNISDETLEDVVIRDYRPDYIDLIEDPGYRDGEDIVIKVGTLVSGEEKIYYIKGRVVDDARLTLSTNISCVTNRVKASNDDVSDEDSSQLCLEKNVTTETPTTTIPSTGAAENVLALAFSGVGIYFGRKLRKTNV